MQTRFIASQRYYGSYHCRNQSIQESRYLLPLFLLFLSSSPRSPPSLTVTRWATNRNGVSSSQLPLTTSSSVLLRPQLIPKRRGVWAPAYWRTGVNYSDSNKREHQTQRAAIGDPRKTTKTETRSLRVSVYACTISRRAFPAFVAVANQSN